MVRPGLPPQLRVCGHVTLPDASRSYLVVDSHWISGLDAILTLSLHTIDTTPPHTRFADSKLQQLHAPKYICAMSLRKRAHDLAKRTPRKLRNLFQPEHLQQSRSSPDPSPSPSTADPHVQDPCATTATSSACPPTSEQQPTPPLRVHTTPPAGDAGSRNCLQPMSTSEIRERTYTALTKRLASEELRRVKWEGSEGSTAKIIEDLKTTLRENNQHSKTTSNILQHINKYCAIVDITTQHPDITALVWARIQPLTQVSRALNNVSFWKQNLILPLSWRPITTKPS